MTFYAKYVAIAAILGLAQIGSASAADRVTKDEAVAMVKKAVAFIKTEGPDKAYAAITSKDPRFVDRELYVMVHDLTGKCLAHGSNAKLVGRDMSDMQDTDGKYYVRERIELAKKQPTMWIDYKFTNPVTKKIEPKSAYCERLDDTTVCAGVYK